jgi:3-oxoacyl-[acyl-carrier protein] reductase
MTTGCEQDRGGSRSRVAVVTGAGGGIGRELVAGLLGLGFSVAATDVDSEALAGFHVSDDQSPRLDRIVMDVCDRAQAQRVAETVCSTRGGVDVLINNAGLFRKSSLLAQDDTIARRIIDVNLIGAMICMSVFGAVMSRRRLGRIINIASIAGITGAVISPAYAASKAGLIAATRSAARELADHGITVNAIAPGYCDTPMLAPDKEMVQAFTVPRIPMKRVASPAEVAEVALFLATCRTTYMAGSVLTLDGGLHVG